MSTATINRGMLEFTSPISNEFASHMNNRMMIAFRQLTFSNATTLTCEMEALIVEFNLCGHLLHFIIYECIPQHASATLQWIRSKLT